MSHERSPWGWGSAKGKLGPSGENRVTEWSGEAPGREKPHSRDEGGDHWDLDLVATAPANCWHLASVEEQAGQGQER